MLIMIEYCMQKEKKINVIDTVIPEITNNPEKRIFKIKINNLPMYGIISLIIVLIGGIVVFGLISGIVLLFISLSPVILFVADLFVL